MDTINSKEKTIEKYLHLYLGCEVKTPKGIETLVMVGLLGSEQQRVRTHKKFDSFSNGYNIPEVKPVLRPLSDMTEEEAAHIGQLVYGKPDSIKWRIEHKNGYLKICRKHYQKAITIDYASADLDFYDGDELDTSLRQIEIFQYLLSKSFDLFGLIEAGLAIDKTTQQKAL